MPVPPGWDDDPYAFDAAVGEPKPLPGGARALELRDLVLRVRPEPGPDDGLPGVLTGGTVLYDGREYRLTEGRFVALAEGLSGRRLRYRIQAETAARERIEVAGVKFVTGRPWRWWTDTTRMPVLVSTPDSDSPCAAGMVRIGIGAFARQLTTFRGRPGLVAAFLVRFAGRLALPSRAGRRGVTHRSEEH